MSQEQRVMNSTHGAVAEQDDAIDSGVIVLTRNNSAIDVRSRVQRYYILTKPGIIIANLMTAAAGYQFAVRWHVQPMQLVSLLIGTGLIIASACVWNNYIDRDIDKLMMRTRGRAMAAASIPYRHAWVFAVVLGVLGFAALAFTNRLTIAIGVIAIFSYVIAYGIAKRKSEFGTLVGTLPGAAALLAGYTAATGRFDVTALLLLLVMATWQLPHFYAIAIWRLSDYRNAGLPVWPVKRGIASAKRQIVLFIVVFMIACWLLAIIGHAGLVFAAVMSMVSARWLVLAARGFKTSDNTAWAKAVFLFSLVTVLALSVLLPLGTLLP